MGGMKADNMRLIIVLILVLFGSYGVNITFANGGYDIEVSVENCDRKEAYLAYYLGPNQYIQDTAKFANGSFRFKGEEPLAEGFYLVVFPPDNQYFHVLIDKDQQDIEISVKGTALQKPFNVSGSDDTRLFYEYAEFLGELRPKADALRKQLEQAEGSEKNRIETELETLNTEVEVKQASIERKYPDYLTTMMVKAHTEFKEPEFTGSEKEVKEKTYIYYRNHYFDNIALADPRIVRTPFVHERITYYLDNLTYQTPDSINKSLDYILNHFNPGGEAFKVYLVYFLNKYAKSNVVGMDAVYVHLVENYYAKGLADWTDEEQLKKIIDNAQTLKPILIGKVAPNLILQDRNKQTWDLHKVDALYTVLFFWDPECGHCKKSIPELIDFYKTYKSKGIEVYAVCTKLKDGVPECWEAVDERGMDMWINVADPYLASRYKQIYDIRVTPQIFVLDKDNKIVMKKIGAEQLPEVMDHLLADEDVR